MASSRSDPVTKETQSQSANLPHPRKGPQPTPSQNRFVNISQFFIDRPIFATVLSIVITIVGGIALLTLPVAQYPEIAPPTVQVSCAFPGANAKTIAETIGAPIEQQVNGVENMLYMSSQSA